MELLKQWRRWFPESVDRAAVADRLDAFYENSVEYHAMTSSGDKTQEPHVLLLSSLLVQVGNYAEIGCGGGTVCRLVGEVGAVTGVDLSEIALNNAAKRCEGSKYRASFIKASADQLPLQDNVFDGAYAFEVMEHVWDPERMMKEMIRIVKPGGFVLLSIPNRFSLDLHLQKRRIARMFDISCACIRRICDAVTRQPFMHVRPDLDHGVYPDCDMITAVVPVNVARLMAKLGCDIEFWDTTFMCACRPGSSTSLQFQRYTAVPFFKHFGDHLLILGRKKVEGGCHRI